MQNKSFIPSISSSKLIDICYQKDINLKNIFSRDNTIENILVEDTVARTPNDKDNYRRTFFRDMYDPILLRKLSNYAAARVILSLQI